MPASEQGPRDAGIEESGPTMDLPPHIPTVTAEAGVRECKHALYELSSVLDVDVSDDDRIVVTFDSDHGRGTGSALRLLAIAGWEPIRVDFGDRQIAFQPDDRR